MVIFHKLDYFIPNINIKSRYALAYTQFFTMASIASDNRRIRILECLAKSFAKLAPAIQNINLIDHDLKIET